MVDNRYTVIVAEDVAEAETKQGVIQAAKTLKEENRARTARVYVWGRFSLPLTVRASLTRR